MLQLSLHIAELISIALVSFIPVFVLKQSCCILAVRVPSTMGTELISFILFSGGDEIYKYLTGLKAVRYLCNLAFARLCEPIILAHI